jgi:hypothetical protein
MSEIWKRLIIDDITYNYEVSNLGNVRSTITKNILKTCLRNGYLSLTICNINIKKTYNVHQLIALIFLGKKDNDQIIINHKNGDKIDNKIENLEYITYKENTQHAIENKLAPKVTKKVHKLDPKTSEILKTYNSILEAAEDNDMDGRHISCVCKGTRTTSGGFKWKYVDDIEILLVTADEDNKEITGFPNYLISKDGKVYSKKYRKYLEQKTLPAGYKTVKLCNDDTDTKIDFRIHIIVADHFLETPKIDRKLLIVNHKDGDKSNNKLDNLEYMTQKENMNHYQTVLKKKTVKTDI